MANMSYCRFENTARDLNDCLEAIDNNDMQDMSEHEVQGLENLLETCIEIVAYKDEIKRAIKEHFEEEERLKKEREEELKEVERLRKIENRNHDKFIKKMDSWTKGYDLPDYKPKLI
tara:strand:+ start:1113 stop:1463 length:351 start_codon:yes stop_codon:yes gene_type:complete